MPSKDVKKKKVVSGVKKVVASKKRPIKGAGYTLSGIAKYMGLKQNSEQKRTLYEKRTQIEKKIGEGLDIMENLELSQKQNNGDHASNDWYSPNYATALKDIILGGNLLDLLRDYRKAASKSFLYKIEFMGNVEYMPLKTYDDVASLFRKLINIRKQRWKRIEKKMAIRPPGPHGPPGPHVQQGQSQQGQSQQVRPQDLRAQQYQYQQQQQQQQQQHQHQINGLPAQYGPYGQSGQHISHQYTGPGVFSNPSVISAGGFARRKKRVTKLSGKKPKKLKKTTKKKRVTRTTLPKP